MASFNCCAFLAMLVPAMLIFQPTTAHADTALAAVAANFAETAEALIPKFRETSGHDLQLTTGSTGKLYAQIGEGAPFDLFLSADAATPARLLAEGNAVNGTAFSYAIGRLALWSSEKTRFGANARAVLKDPNLRFVAIANPELAPYGVAAREVLQNLDLWDALQPKIVKGQNIGQTNSMVASGAAEVGFVALSAVLSSRTDNKGSRWDVPQELFSPIRQNVVLLNHGAHNDAARAFMEFLRTPEAIEVIEAFGYGTGS